MSFFQNKGGQTAGPMAVKKLQADIGAYLTEQDRELVQGPMFLLPRLTKGNSGCQERNISSIPLL